MYCSRPGLQRGGRQGERPQKGQNQGSLMARKWGQASGGYPRCSSYTGDTLASVLSSAFCPVCYALYFKILSYKIAKTVTQLCRPFPEQFGLWAYVQAPALDPGTKGPQCGLHPALLREVTSPPPA